MPFTPVDDAWFPASWALLGELMRAARRPTPIDRRGWPRTHLVPPPSAPADCLVFLADPSGRWSHPIVAARTLGPGTALLVLCPAWLARDGERLLCRAGIWSTAGGQMYLDTFDPPRPVSYFANHLTAPDTLGVRSDGDAMEVGLVCPMSSSTELSLFVGCKVSTRVLSHLAGVSVPRCLAVFRAALPDWLVDAAARTSGHVELLPARASHEPWQAPPSAYLADRIAATVDRWPAGAGRVVVKPSGLMHMQSRGVSFHPRMDTRAAAEAVAHLLSGASEVPIAAGDAILIEEFVGGAELTLRIRSVVGRHEGDEPGARVLRMICGVASSSGVVDGYNTFSQELAEALCNLGVSAPEVAARALEASARRSSERAFLAITHAERPPPDKPNARTDLLGLDFIVAIGSDPEGRPSVSEPVLIEVNNHDCTDVFHSHAANLIGGATAALAEPDAGVLGGYLLAAARRSHAFLLQGRTLLAIGTGGAVKRFAWDRVRRTGVRVIVANSAPPIAVLGLDEPWAMHLSAPGLERQGEDHDGATCESILRALRERGIFPDGVITFVENYTPVAALIAERLGLRGNSPLAQRTAKSKLATLQALVGPTSAGHGWLSVPRALAAPFADLRTPRDVWSAGRQIRYPAMLKQYFGSSAVGSRRVESPEEAEREAERLLELVRDPSGADKLYPMCGFAHGGAHTGVLLMEFVEGTEHDVDLILFDGEVVDAFVSDNGPVDLPTCAETTALMPSALSPGRAQQLVAAAHQACEAVGLRHGVINVELKLSPTGPKVIDINGRMGGFYNPSWIHAIWQADLPAAVCALAMGVRPDRRLTDEPRCHIAGVMIFPADRPDIHAARDRGALIVDMRTPGAEP